MTQKFKLNDFVIYNDGSKNQLAKIIKVPSDAALEYKVQNVADGITMWIVESNIIKEAFPETKYQPGDTVFVLSEYQRLGTIKSIEDDGAYLVTFPDYDSPVSIYEHEILCKKETTKVDYMQWTKEFDEACRKGQQESFKQKVDEMFCDKGWKTIEEIKSEKEYEYINKPDHYQGDKVMQIIEEFNLDFCLGNVTKYILRAGKKPNEDSLKDLKKALWYLNREIENLEKHND